MWRKRDLRKVGFLLIGYLIDTTFGIQKFRAKDFIIHCAIEGLPTGTKKCFETDILFLKLKVALKV